MKLLLFILFLYAFFLISCNKKSDKLSYSESISNALAEFESKNIDPESDSVVITYHSSGSPKLIYYGPGDDNHNRGNLVELYPSGIKKMHLSVKGNHLTYGEQLEFLDNTKKYFFINSANGDTMVVSRPQLSKYYFYDLNEELIFKRVYDSLENPAKTISNKLIYSIDNNYPEDIRFYIVPEPNRYKSELMQNIILKIDCGDKIVTEKLDIDENYSAVFYKPKSDLSNCEITAVVKYWDEYFMDGKSITNDPIVDSVKIKF